VAAGPAPEASYRESARKIADAAGKAGARELRPYKPTLPMTVTIRMTHVEVAAKAAQRPGVQRLDDHTVEARVGRQCEVVKWIVGTGLDMA
jgi:D-aminopeptidase